MSIPVAELLWLRGLRLSKEQALDIGRALIESGGRHVDEANPLVDVALTGGIRVHVTLPPIALSGTEISIRISRHRSPELTRLNLARANQVIPALISAVENRQTILISGATGSGKTTLLGALMAYATPAERLVILEEVHEITVNHPRGVPGVSSTQYRGGGEVTLSRLVRESPANETQPVGYRFEGARLRMSSRPSTQAIQERRDRARVISGGACPRGSRVCSEPWRR